MAIQKGIIRITGTLGDVTFYRMGGEYYARKKSSLKGERVLTAPEFAGTRVYSQRMAAASAVAAELYRRLPETQREVSVYRGLVREALRLLKEGCVVEELRERLMRF